MIIALLIGRKGSTGFPGKNTTEVLGKPLMVYPLEAAKKAKGIDEIYISTDDEKIIEIGNQFGVKIINRPAELCTEDAVADDVFVHAYGLLKKEYEKQGKKIEMMVLLFCNAPMVTPEQIEEGIRILRENPEYDSVATVSKYNMWGPVRARKIEKDGLLYPVVPFEKIGEARKINCNRDSHGDVWFHDVGLSIVRPRAIEDIKNGLPPQRWLGKKIYPLKQCGGLDVDFEWELPQVRSWLKRKWREKNKGKISPKADLSHIVRIENAPETRAGFLRLDKNENTLGVDQEFIEKVRERITSDFINMYPEVYRLNEKISNTFGIEKEKIFVTAGSDAAIKSTFEAFVDEGDEVLILDPTYAMYYIYSTIFGAKLVKVGFISTFPIS